MATSPEITAVVAGALPLYGTWSISTPVIDLNNSPARWPGAPAPLEENVSAPRLAFASAINSLTVFAGTEGCSASTFGTVATAVIGAKSFCTSYGSFSYRLGTIVSGAPDPISRV